MKLNYSEKQIVRLAVYISVFVVLGLYINSQKHWLASMTLLLIGASFFRPFMNFYNGQMAEYDVRDILYTLPKEWHFESNLILKNNGNIDHVVVGPTGIWTIEVKSHIGKITFDGNQLLRNNYPFEKNFLNQAWAESFALRDFLRDKLQKQFEVQPVLLFTSRGARLRFGFRKQKGVYVIGSNWLLNLLQNTVVQTTDQNTIELVANAIRAIERAPASLPER